MLRRTTLDDIRILAVTGPDRQSFLQGQLTQDVTRATRDRTLIAGWADARGRLQFAGHFFAMETAGSEALALLVPAETAEALLKRLRMYVLRAKVQVDLLDSGVTGLTGTPPADSATTLVQLAGDGRHVALDASGAGLTTTEALRTEWQLANIRAGIPEIVTATTSEFVPQMVNLDLLEGISFTKGCYTGQEIVARMKYLGRVKRRMLRFSTAAAPPAPATGLFAERGQVGMVVSSAPTRSGSEFLAVVGVGDLPGPFFLDEERCERADLLTLPYEIPELAPG